MTASHKKRAQLRAHLKEESKKKNIRHVYFNTKGEKINYMDEKERTVTITIEEYNNLIGGELERSLIFNYISHHVGYDEIYNQYTLENASALYEILVALGYVSLLKEMKQAKEGAENGL